MNMKQHFKKVSDGILNSLKSGERANIEYFGEDSHFMRYNNAKVRQSGTVQDGYLTLNLFYKNKAGKLTFPLSGNPEQDKLEAANQLDALRKEVKDLPDDPYLVEPADYGQSEAEFEGLLPDRNTCSEEILDKVQDVDFTGIYAGGKVMRGMKNSAGTEHWFSTENYSVDFSMITAKEKMLKGTIAGNQWNKNDYDKQILRYKEQLVSLEKPSKTIEAGKYRIYLAPAAVADLVNMLSWNGISESAIRQGSSALLKCRDEKLKLSDKFTLSENFSQGSVPRFNEQGMMSEERISLFNKGEFKSALINARTAKEYSLKSNAANGEEGLRAVELATGQLKQDDILKKLDTGLYLSNLHYLNWSDLSGGRITGMTRYACFWVEKGKIIAPIENMRFDETLYQFFGGKLIDLTDFSELIPVTDTYFRREIGGTRVPGMLVDDFTFNL